MDLKKLATELTTDQVKELLARRMLIDEVEFTKSKMEIEPDEEAKAEYADMLASRSSLAEVTCFNIEILDVESDLLGKVSELATEYTTKEAE